MDEKPLLPLTLPRFAPRSGHYSANLRSPIRNQLADDILADLSPATTFEAFISPSGRLKAIIEAAAPSERAFGLRATLASKKIQEWVEELSGWPWPAENTSLGFEIPPTKRRKILIQGNDRGRRDSEDGGKEPQYLGSLLAAEVEIYESRINVIMADMEDLDVEAIKRQVLDTLFSTRSRPSSSASNAPHLPSLFASYSLMDDLTAVITATVLQSLPHLSRLILLIDAWNIRLTILRKVPSLMWALDDAETALKSGWTAIQSQRPSTPTRNGRLSEDQHLSRKSFDMIRNVLEHKVKTLGQELDYMLDTLEGRQDTLPEAWLDRMERIENDYGSWVVSGDRQVREGERVKMVKAREEEDDAPKPDEGETEATARRKGKEKAQEAARLKEERQVKETVALGTLGAAEEAEAAETARLKAREEAQESTRLEFLGSAEQAGATRLHAAQEAQAGAARLRSEQGATRTAELVAVNDAENAEAAKLLLEQEAQASAARIQAEEQICKTAQQTAARESEAIQRKAEAKAQELTTGQVAKLTGEADVAHSRLEKAPDNARRHASKAGQEAETTRAAQQEAEKIANRQAEQLVQSQMERDFAPATSMRARKIELVDSPRDQYAEVARPRSFSIAEANLISKRRAEQEMVTQRQAQQAAQTPAQSELNSEPTILAKTKAQQETGDAVSAYPMKRISSRDRDAEDESFIQDVDFDVCVELEQNMTSCPLQHSALEMGSAASSSAARMQEFVDLFIATDPNDDIDPQISQCAPFDGHYKDSESAIRNTEIEIFNNSSSTFSPDLASPIHLDDSFPQTPTSPTLSSAAKVFNSPTSEEATSPNAAKALQFGHNFANFMRTTSQNQVSPNDTEQQDMTPVPGCPTLAKSLLCTDGASDYFEPDQDVPEETTDEWIMVKCSHHQDLNAEVHDSHGEDSHRRLSTIFGYATAEPSREIQDAQPAENPVSPKRSPEPSTENPDMIALPAIAQATLTPIRIVPSLDGTETPTRSCAPFMSGLSSSDSSHSMLSPVVEERSFRPELQSVDGLCEPCDIAVRELTSSEGFREKSLQVLDRELPTIPIERSAQPISIPRSPASAEVTFHGATDAQYSVSMPLDGSLTRTNNPLSVSSVSSSTINVKHQCLLRTVDDPPTLVEGVPGTWMVVPPQSIISICCTSDLPLLPASFIDSATRGILTPRRESVASVASNIVTSRVSESPLSPIGSPVSDEPVGPPEDSELSPLKGRVGHRSSKSYSLSLPDSPSGMPIRPALRPAQDPALTPSSGTAPSTPFINIPSTPLEAPIFGNLDVATTPMICSPTKANSDEQLQQQISSLLESIPARIRLTSESDGTPISSHTLRPQRSRRSITPSARSSSSMSNYSASRAPTPSFTLTPAYGKTSSRIRAPSNNPEVKLYHLSRSTGEAPIKLFVRLVGEHGERVMVRVGGGWADLGEYLKEYASHHGRRAGSTRESVDKIEIQDLPSRQISSSSTITPGRSSPAPRAQSVLERERPGSSFSLHVRKTRKSVGESSFSDPATTRPRLSGSRAPSTPLPTTTARRSYETPPSTKSSPETGRSSRMSWTDEDSNLGLAGPKSKNLVISERDQEWVESIKEKVRLASAEKAKGKPGGAKGEGNYFGQMDRVGGTKRLFRKGEL